MLTSVGVFTIIQQEELMGWHTSRDKRTRIRVIGGHFTHKEKKISSSYPSSNYRGSTVFQTSTKYAYLYLVCKVPVFITFACSSTISGSEGICILSCSRHFSNSSYHPLLPHLAETLLQAFGRLFFFSWNCSFDKTLQCELLSIVPKFSEF